MGEWSKKIGEYGEKTVENFLSAVGWNDLLKGVPIKCINNEHINKEGKPSQTHGIDFLYSHLNPLVTGQLNNIIISSKYQTKKYPNSPTKQFKAFINDLIHTMECFAGSITKDDILKRYPFSSVNDTGVLFWLHNNEKGSDDLISAIASARIDTIHDNTIYVVDNKRIAFILGIMKFIKIEQKYQYSFYYPLTGRNLDPQNRRNTGIVLPVEYLNSSIIPIKLQNKDNPKETCLFIATIDNFETNDFMRLMGLAKDLSTKLAGEVIIGFPDYNELKHQNKISQVKQGFQDAPFTKTVTVVNYMMA